MPSEELKTAEQTNVPDASMSVNAGNTSSVSTWYETVVSEEAVPIATVRHNKNNTNPNMILFLVIRTSPLSQA
jgi:hypothetical protein